MRLEEAVKSPQEILAPLDESAIRAGLVTRRIGTTIHLFQEVDSTNDEAVALASRSEAEGAIVIAEAQRRGRGRLGRRWQSPRGLGLYLSVILRPTIPPHGAPVLTLMGAVAGVEAIERTTGLITALKWPNDLIVHGRKVGGMLSEMAVEGSRLLHVILGIGINVNQTEADFDGELRQTAGSLRVEAGHPVDRTAIVRSFCESLDSWYERFLSDSSLPILEHVRRRCLTLGRQVTARSGDQEISGLAVELESDGRLVIRDARGALHHLLAGDVTLTG
ncbi:biotin--[acetyl-CoA-carboxylase] ligase [Candidatus Methylomirabilis sp.]|uniref:biotin--[acetyl-CoA-carboxylase] ligase n=1 Tax=Candidatus Methylomirabilis sp. TaxID=2032687 RepID=UPI003076255A